MTSNGFPSFKVNLIHRFDIVNVDDVASLCIALHRTNDRGTTAARLDLSFQNEIAGVIVIPEDRLQFAVLIGDGGLWQIALDPYLYTCLLYTSCPLFAIEKGQMALGGMISAVREASGTLGASVQCTDVDVVPWDALFL